MSAADTIIGLLRQIKDAIGGEPPPADILEIVKKALEKKLADKSQMLVSLIHNEFYDWLRTTIGPKASNSFWQRPISEARVQSVNALVKGFLIGITQFKEPVIVNLDQVEIIGADIATPDVSKFASEANAYTTALLVIRRVVDEAMINPGASPENFTRKKEEILAEFDKLVEKKIESLPSAAAGGGANAGKNQNPFARRRNLKSRRRNRKQRKTRKHK